MQQLSGLMSADSIMYRRVNIYSELAQAGVFVLGRFHRFTEHTEEQSY